MIIQGLQGRQGSCFKNFVDALAVTCKRYINWSTIRYVDDHQVSTSCSRVMAVRTWGSTTPPPVLRLIASLVLQRTQSYLFFILSCQHLIICTFLLFDSHVLSSSRYDSFLLMYMRLSLLTHYESYRLPLTFLYSFRLCFTLMTPYNSYWVILYFSI